MTRRIQLFKFIFSEIGYVMVPCILVATLFSSCENNGRRNTNGETEQTNHSHGPGEKFMAKAAVIHLEQIQLGQLAQKNSVNIEVIHLGKMMVDEHSKLLIILREFALKKEVAIPTSIANGENERQAQLLGVQGPDFDLAYCNLMVNSHQEAIRKFEAVYGQTTDYDTRDWVGTTMGILRNHLDSAISCQKFCEKIERE